MKKIFYSMMAVALCACSQSEVEDMVTPLQPENKGVTFEVVDNGFVDGDGTRVKYGEYGAEDAYVATFEEGNTIGLYAIDPAQIDQKTGVPNDAAYNAAVRNVKLTLKNGKWTSAEPLEFTSGTLLFAYAPYNETDRTSDTATTDDAPSFTKNSDSEWEVNTGNNRFFVGYPCYTVTDNGSKDAFEKADMMGATYTVKGTENEVITFEMKHMREMIELTIHKDATLDNVSLTYGTDADAAKNKFTPYFVNENVNDRNIKIYRFLTTEYSKVNVVYATVTYKGEQKQYKKTLSGSGVGKCFWVNISSEAITAGEESLSTILAREYGADYATNPELRSLRLEGELLEGDWATLASLEHLRSLNMSALQNKSIPNDWMKNATTLKKTLTSLVLPNGLTTIGSDALQVENVANINIPATVTTIGTGAFYWCTKTAIRIPEGSQLATVGNGVFYNTKAVYTYENNLHVLVLPETLTSIGHDGPFNAINQLRKIVFKGATPPTRTTAGKEGELNPFDAKAVIYVPNTDYKNKSLFPGNTVYAGPHLTADDYKAVDINGYTLTSAWEGSLSALCDGPANTHWHSDYQYYHDYDQWGIYIDITLPKEYSGLKLSYTSRWEGADQLPKKVRIGVSADGSTFTETNVYAADALATEKNQTKDLAIDATSPYRKVRFGVIRSVAGGNSADGSTNTDAEGHIAENVKQAYVYTSLSELTVYEEKWTE